MQGIGNGLDLADQNICLVCRTILLRSSDFDGTTRWVHEQGRSIWASFHLDETTNTYSEPMPMH